jgi:POT family proton-dependent oligopeptide transporter
MSSVEGAVPATDKHPKGLSVLFATELWERFGFYSMSAMLTLYLRDPARGFGFSTAHATSIYSWYLAFVYGFPLIGGLIADRWTGYRRAVFAGGLFFMAGYALLTTRSLPTLYAALALLVVGNGLFKPNVSTMVGNLYVPGSHLKDRAYNIFYMGINIGALMAPIVAEFIAPRFGFNVAFGAAALGMVVAVATLSLFWRYLAGTDSQRGASAMLAAPAAPQAIDAVPEWKRIGALIVIFLISIVFWMVFFQNGSTLTYWANDNTAWRVSGIISNAINPAFIVLLSFPLVWFWKWLDRRGREPSVPAKMAIGMFLTTACFGVMFMAGRAGGDAGRVSPIWLIAAYLLLSVGELMLSPMGLSLVSKVAPARMRGLMMGGWFLTLSLGGKLTSIGGDLWDTWRHSDFFLLLAVCTLIMGFLLLALLKPLKKAMPGV